MLRSREKIAVALSGGVDSAVAAALLQREGYAPTAFFARGWSPKESRCDWAAEERDAMRVAARLGIPFRSVDLGDAYEREVVAPLLAGYAAGRAVNPDVWCNKAIKFGALLAAARAEGFSTLATGHYARLVTVPAATSGAPRHHDPSPENAAAHLAAGRRANAQSENSHVRLYRGVDAAKDQSYFLWALGQDELRAAMFPIGGLTKPEVRALAQKLDLPVADKPDSQGVCFVGEMDFKHFLRARLGTKTGIAVDSQGSAIGRHDGAHLYVPGERVALADVAPAARGKTFFVTAVDVSTNKIAVAETNDAPRDAIALDLENVSETEPGALARAAACQLRYRTAPVALLAPAHLAAGRRAIARVEAPGFAPARGQSAVFYAADGECLGGGEVASWHPTP